MKVWHWITIDFVILPILLLVAVQLYLNHWMPVPRSNVSAIQVEMQ